MCELFAMSSRNSVDVSFSLGILAEHGGTRAPHQDGWGIAYYEDHDVRIIRDTTSASASKWARFIEEQFLNSTIVIAHLRKATLGAIAIRNTQPFSRELAGRMHVFAHNGHLPAVKDPARFPLCSFHPVGDTDSEYAFCALLERLQPLWLGGAGVPNVATRHGIIRGFAKELRQFGPANFLYCDSEVLFAHSDRRTQDDGSIRPPGLHRLHRQCSGKARLPEPVGVSIGPATQDVVLIASVPLTDEQWEPLHEGEVIAIAGGRVAGAAL
jgi:glutamine amidotransferase